MGESAIKEAIRKLKGYGVIETVDGDGHVTTRYNFNFDVSVGLDSDSQPVGIPTPRGAEKRPPEGRESTPITLKETTKVTIKTTPPTPKGEDMTIAEQAVLAHLTKTTGIKRTATSPQLTARLKAGATVEDCCLVIDYLKATWSAEFVRKHLDQKTPFRPEGWATKLDSARAWGKTHRPELVPDWTEYEGIKIPPRVMAWAKKTAGESWPSLIRSDYDSGGKWSNMMENGEYKP